MKRQSGRTLRNFNFKDWGGAEKSIRGEQTRVKQPEEREIAAKASNSGSHMRLLEARKGGLGHSVGRTAGKAKTTHPKSTGQEKTRNMNRI